MADWRPMGTAPRDGTIILVCETANGESFNVLPAAYMNMHGGDPRMGQDPKGIVDWWAVFASRRTGEGGDCKLPVRWSPLASVPVCWQPMPKIEADAKLKRRMAQLLRKSAHQEPNANA